jgi:hypothetical protein
MEPLAEGHVDRMAVTLLDQETELDLQSLEALMGERQRYSALKPLLAGRTDNVLTKALRRLQENGAIQAGLTPDLKTKTYGLTAIGKLCVLRVHEFRPIETTIGAYLAAHSAA